MGAVTIGKIIGILIISYLLGGLSFGWIVANAKGIDILHEGSGNPGFTNVWRTLGIKCGILALIGDAAKGFLAVFLGGHFLGDLGVALALVMVVFGHSFSYMLHFKGGKGIATAAGALLYISPIALLVCFVVLVLLVAVTKYMSIGSLSVAILCPIIMYVTHEPPVLVGTITILAVYIIWLHRGNIKRLINGTENKIGKKRS